MACTAAHVLADHGSLALIVPTTTRCLSRIVCCQGAGSFVIQLIRDKFKTKSYGQSDMATVYISRTNPQDGRRGLMPEASATIKYASKKPDGTSSEP
jgi:hypothetical protein